jgi:cell division protein FtsQ
VRLVDADGVVIERLTGERARRPGLPRVEVDLAAPAPSPRCAPASRFATGLPPELRRIVRRIGATTPDRVELRLAGGARVDWGSGDETPRKAQVLLALLPQKASLYDVRSPATPAVRK